jgi:CheY-like chemotaxis protein
MAPAKILIIDDDVALQNTFRKALKNEGYELLFADDGKSGLELVAREKPILIFLDLLMPVMNGFEFLEKIQPQPDDPYNIIVITGHGSDTEIQRCFKLGVNFFLRKPLSMVEICCLAQKCIAMKELEQERTLLIAELRKAVDTIKALKRILPICASCKKVRLDNGYWQEVEAFLQANADMDFSHSICPACIKTLYPELKKK